LRINKYVSETGKASRRGADKLIQENRVKINGKTAKIGDQVKPGDKIIVDGERLNIVQDHIYIALNKPVGVTCTGEKSVKKNIIDLVNLPIKINHVGRLDKDSEGLILLTNDGDIINEILRGENKNEKEYYVSVNKPITPEFIKQMESGVKILKTKTLPCKINQLSKFEFEITLTQGLNRQIRRMCETLGYEVVNLKRLRIMNIHLNNLPVGQWRYLSKKEKERLFSDLNYEPVSW